MNAYAGIDIAKEWFDVQVLDGGAERFPNTPAGCQALIRWFAGQPFERIVLEGSGGYQRLVVASLAAAQFPVVVVNPRQVRDFAKATGALAKTDRIDARTLARFAQAIQPPLRPIPDEKAQNLRDLLARPAQLVEMCTMEQNRLHQARLARVIKDLKTSLEFLNKQLTKLEREIDDDLHSSPLWQAKFEILKSVKGVGAQTARTLILELPELGESTRHQVAALAGLAPMNNDSGKFQGQRRIIGGRKVVRCALYMAAMSAVRHNPPIATHYQKLRAAGKAYKVTIVACMRKLLVMLNAMLRKKQLWQPNFAA